MNPDGITEWIFWFGQPDFTLVGNPFGFWMEQTHPDVADQLEFGAWESVEEAEETGCSPFSTQRNGPTTSRRTAAWTATNRSM